MNESLKTYLDKCYLHANALEYRIKALELLFSAIDFKKKILSDERKVLFDVLELATEESANLRHMLDSAVIGMAERGESEI